MIGFNKIRSMHVVRGDPFVVAFWKTFPFDQILKLLGTSMLAMIEDSFNLLLFFAVDQVRRWLREVRSMISSFSIREEE
jgi:hypothetical protein